MSRFLVGGIVTLGALVALAGVRAKADCTIALEPQAILGDLDGDGAMYGAPSSVARDSRGRYYVTTPWVGGESLPFIFEASGKFLKRLGRPGEGPGELKEPGFVLVGPTDSVYVFDPANFRMSVFNPDLEFARSVTGAIGYSLAGAFMENRNLLLSVGKNSGHPLDVYSLEGYHLASLGTVVLWEPPYGTESMELARLIAPASAGGAWTARTVFKFELQQWTPEGDLRVDVDKAPNWFNPYSEYVQVTPDAAPSPMLKGLWEDEAGLWVYAEVADPKWRAGIGPLTRHSAGWTMHSYDPRKVYDALFELRDTQTGEVIFTQRLDEGRELFSAFPPGMITKMIVSDLGWIQLEILDLRFECQGPM